MEWMEEDVMGRGLIFNTWAKNVVIIIGAQNVNVYNI